MLYAMEVNMEEEGMPAEQIEQTTAMMGLFFEPWAVGAMQVVSTAVWCLVLGVVASLFLKTT